MNKLNRFLKKLITYESSPTKLTYAFCIGTYIAFSPYPFPFGHTGLVFLFAWLLGLNLTVTWVTSVFINNPWTMIPVYGSDYIFGHWLIHSVCNIHPTNPAWMISLNGFLEQTLGMPHFCLWSFLIGGNLLGIMLAAMLYPIMKPLFSKLVANHSINS